MCSDRGGHEANLLSVRDATILCGEPKNNRECSSFLSFSPTTLDLIYPLLDDPPTDRSTVSPTPPGLSECRRGGRLYGLDGYRTSTRNAHDRKPSITHDPVCDAWIDRQVRPHFRLFGSYLSPPHEISFRPKQGSLIRFRATLFESQLF